MFSAIKTHKTDWEGPHKNQSFLNTLATPVGETKRFKNEKWNQVDIG